MSPTLSHVFSSVARPYSFTHALLRDSVYEATPKLRRADLHERLGGICSEQSGASDELVAFHLERAARLRSELRPRRARSSPRAPPGISSARASVRWPEGTATPLARCSRALRLCSTTGRQHGSGSRRASRSQAGRPTRSSSSRATSSAATGCGRSPDVAGWVSSIGPRISPSGAQVALKVIAPQLAGDSRFRRALRP